MPEEHYRAERVEALQSHPLTHGICLDPGWVGIVERLYAAISKVDPMPFISDIKEKYGSLRVHNDSSDPAVEAAIERAEGESARTCQICGCRGRPCSVGGWSMTLCAAHAAEREGGARRLGSKGRDYPREVFALAACPDADCGNHMRDSGGRIRLHHGTLSGSMGGSGFGSDYFSGLIEPKCLVVSFAPDVAAAALGDVPFKVTDARQAFIGLAEAHGRDMDRVREMLALRWEERDGDNQIEGLTSMWKLLDFPTALN